MFVYFIILIVLLFSSCPAAGKTISGVFRSDAARENNGQYITRFLYHGACLILINHIMHVHFLPCIFIHSSSHTRVNEYAVNAEVCYYHDR